jgi:hypothetical protein
MQNSKNSEKSRGIVVFAINTDTVDYVRIADQTSLLAQKNLGLPITLITDNSARPKFKYDNVVIIDTPGDNWREGGVQWRNFGRHYAYQLSPYDETILVDTDYLILDDSLNMLFATDFDYKLMHHNTNYIGAVYEQMGETSLPYIWATVILFRKTVKSQLLFELVGKIQRNYRYYRAVYNIREGNYRNDYAFAIANNIINGYNSNESQGIPWRMLTVEDKISRIMLTDTQIRIYHEDRASVLPYQNIHVMDKAYLQSRDFEQAVEVICGAT